MHGAFELPCQICLMIISNIQRGLAQHRPRRRFVEDAMADDSGLLHGSTRGGSRLSDAREPPLCRRQPYGNRVH